MACYMQEKYVSEAIDSILACNFDLSDAEMILWDDLSSDSTYDILLDYQRRYPGLIRVMRSPRNLGVADCAAEMVKAASGKYILLFDHDDVMLPFNLAGILDFLDANNEYTASYGRKLLFNDKNGLEGASLGGPYHDFLLLLHPPINNNALIFRRETALAVGNFKCTDSGRASGAADIFMWIRLRLAGKLHFDPTPRLLHRIHPRQVTSRDNQSKVYVNDYRFFLEYVGGIYPELYRNLIAGTGLNFSADQVAPALILLGGMVRNCDNPKDIDRYLYYAKQLAPDDFSVDQQVCEFALRIGRYEDAFRRYVNMFVKYEGDYERLNTLAGLKKVYEKLKIPTADIDFGANLVSRRYFALLPEHEKVVANLRKYNV